MKYERRGGTLNILDVDQTLFNNTAKTKVIRDGKVIARLNTAGLETFKFQPNDITDHSEYSCGRFFYEDAKPISLMIRRAKLVYNLQGPNSKTIIITGRSDMNEKDMFLRKFQENGLAIDDIYVERAGNLIQDGKFTKHNVAGAKAYIVRKYLQNGNFDVVRIWDDSELNLKAVLQLSVLYPEKKFLAYKVNPDNGSIKQIFHK